ncbi:MAG: class I tRNA ligase family protein, partial [Pseudomonadota bacterium]
MADKTAAAPTAADDANARDWSKTLYLPKTDFAMRAGLPKREPEWIARWDGMKLHDRLRNDAQGREPFILHDGPPYANGHLHIGHALNKILKDIIVRSQQMMGKNSHYVPGWDCHGLPIEWKIEEKYRAKGRDKDAIPINEFRKECREFAEHWIGVQREEFRRLGVEGDWWNPYLTMSFHAEAVIANELMKFAMNGSLYRGSKPVMWSVVERTALAEAEVEYHDYQSDMVWVKFPVVAGANTENLRGASVVIWTTTPWTIPANRAISFSPRISYGVFEVTKVGELPDGNSPWATVGEKLIVADALADDVAKNARIEDWTRLG